MKDGVPRKSCNQLLRRRKTDERRTRIPLRSFSRPSSNYFLSRHFCDWLTRLKDTTFPTFNQLSISLACPPTQYNRFFRNQALVRCRVRFGKIKILSALSQFPSSVCFYRNTTPLMCLLSVMKCVKFAILCGNTGSLAMTFKNGENDDVTNHLHSNQECLTRHRSPAYACRGIRCADIYHSCLELHLTKHKLTRCKRAWNVPEYPVVKLFTSLCQQGVLLWQLHPTDHVYYCKENEQKEKRFNVRNQCYMSLLLGREHKYCKVKITLPCITFSIFRISIRKIKDWLFYQFSHSVNHI